jgi:cell division protein FtsB
MSASPARLAPKEGWRRALGRRGGRLVRYGLGFITVVLIIDAIVGEKGLMALREARRNFSAVESALERAKRENAELREEARRLRDDPAAVEDIARRELGLIRPGEKLFIVKNVAPKAK